MATKFDIRDLQIGTKHDCHCTRPRGDQKRSRDETRWYRVAKALVRLAYGGAGTYNVQGQGGRFLQTLYQSTWKQNISTRLDYEQGNCQSGPNINGGYPPQISRITGMIYKIQRVFDRPRKFIEGKPSVVDFGVTDDITGQ